MTAFKPMRAFKPMTPAERQARRRARLKGLLAPWAPRPKRRAQQIVYDHPLMQGLACLDDFDLPQFKVPPA